MTKLQWLCDNKWDYTPTQKDKDEAKKFFKWADSNNSGGVSLDEVREVTAKLEKMFAEHAWKNIGKRVSWKKLEKLLT